MFRNYNRFFNTDSQIFSFEILIDLVILLNTAAFQFIKFNTILILKLQFNNKHFNINIYVTAFFI